MSLSSPTRLQSLKAARHEADCQKRLMEMSARAKDKAHHKACYYDWLAQIAKLEAAA